MSKQRLCRAFFFLVFLEGLISLFFLGDIPSDTKNSILFGFSTFRLILMSGVLFVTLLASVLFFWANFLTKKIDAFFSISQRQYFFTLFFAFLLVVGLLIICVPTQRIGEALMQRLFPPLILAILISLQMLVVQFLWMDKKINWDYLKNNPQVLKSSFIVLLVFIVLWIWIAWSGIGIDRGPSGWLSPGTPILPQQLLFSAFIGFLFFVFRPFFDGYKRKDLLIGLVLWGVTATVWWSEPMIRQSYFTPTPTPPNFEYYPYSDALHYDWFAQNILIGNSRNVGLTHRPLYSLFLAVLHFVGGIGLNNVLFMQVVILAVIPSVVYQLVSLLGNRSAGVMAAVLLMVRERNSIALTNIIEVSHVKLIMSDMPTMLTMVLFIYFFVKWFQEREDKYVFGALAGISLGFSVFIRSQAQLLIPTVLIGMILIERFNWKLFFRKATVFLLGVAIIVAPWVWRNYQLSGRVLVEYLSFYTRLIAGTYSSIPGDADIQPGETDEQYRERVKDQVVEYIVKNPVEVSRFYFSYFLHNEIASVTYLPLSFRFDSIYQYVDTVGFWDAPYLGSVPIVYVPTLFLIICMIALGVGVTFQRLRWIGLMPLLLHLGYSFSSVPVRQSGWRFILPVDWVAILYFCIGLTEFTVLVYSMFSKQSYVTSTFENTERPISWRGTKLALTSFALLGLAIPLVEWTIPIRYPALSNDVVIESQAPNGLALNNDEKISASDLKKFLKTEPDSTVLYGRALYPSYYQQGKVWGDTSASLVELSKYNRLQFQIIGSKNLQVFIPLDEAPSNFPHGSDVFVVGCLDHRVGVRALIIVVNNQVLNTSPWRGLTCSIME